jgi:hypothetical protein
MKKQKQLYLLLLLFAIQHGMSQKSTGHVTLLKKNEAAKVDGHVTLLKRSAAMIYLGGSGSFPLGKDKGLSFLKNTAGVNADVYAPILKKSIISLGLNASSDWSFSNNLALTNIPSPFSIIGENSTSVTATSSSGLKQQNFKFGGGPQLNIHVLDKLIISPIFQVGYMSIAQKNYTATQNSVVTYAGSTDPYSYTLLNISESTSNGLALVPKLRLQYFFNHWIGLWVEGSYNYGPKVKTTVSTFTPDNVPDANGQYQLGQMQDGRTVTEVRQKNYKAVGVAGGLVFSVGTGKPNTERGTKPNGQDDGNSYPPKGKIKKEKLTEDSKPQKNNLLAEENSTKRKCKEYNAPEIINPKNGDNVSLQNDAIQLDYIKSNAVFVNYKVIIWKEVKGKREVLLDKTYPHNFNGKIVGLKLQKDKPETLSVQMQAIPCEQGNCPTDNSDKAGYQKASCTTFTNEGKSNITTFSTSGNSCIPNYDWKLTKAICSDSGKIKVFGWYKISKSNPNQNITSLTLDSVSIRVNNDTVTATELTNSLSNLPHTTTTDTIFYSFKIDGDANCNKEVALKLYFTSTINTGTVNNPNECKNTYQCQATLDSLPCCICRYCEKAENMKIELNQDSATVTADNMLHINQRITVTPKKISKVTAEIVALEEYGVDDACKTCRRSKAGDLEENNVYHFVEANKLKWIVGASINASPANNPHSYPTKILEWETNKQGAVTFDLNVALPSTAALSCCARHGKICIRYSFTDIDCKTCNQLVCYEY